MDFAKTACILGVERTELTYIAITQLQGLTEGLSSFSVQAWTEFGLSSVWPYGATLEARETEANRTWFLPLGTPNIAGDTHMHTHMHK